MTRGPWLALISSMEVVSSCFFICLFFDASGKFMCLGLKIASLQRLGWARRRFLLSLGVSGFVDRQHFFLMPQKRTRQLLSTENTTTPRHLFVFSVLA